MKNSTLNIFEELFIRYPALSVCRGEILKSYEIIESVYAAGGKLLVCGNGGSGADSEHIVGELMKKFKKPRKIKNDVKTALLSYGKEGEKLSEVLEGTLRAITLTSNIALSTAFANDKEPSAVFAQQVYGLIDDKDALVAISTSGNSENCVLAAVTAKAMGAKVVSLTGKNENKLTKLSDAQIRVPETETFKVQEYHLPVYHALCAMLEEENF